MSNVSAKCTSCGAIMEIDNTKEAFICKYCGNAIITEKAIQNHANSIINNVNIQTSGNTINIINNQNKDPNRFEKTYKILISRPSKFIGSAAQWLIDIDNVLYPLSNGESLEIETDLKKINGLIIMKFGDGEQKKFRFTIAGKGNDIEIGLVPTFTQSIKIAYSSCSNIAVIRI